MRRRTVMGVALAAVLTLLVGTVGGSAVLAQRSGLRAAGWLGTGPFAPALLDPRRGDADVGFARAALRTSLLDAPAARTLALAADRKGDRNTAYRWIAQAGLLGWRDAPTQMWLMREGLESGSTGAAMARADALMRIAANRGVVFGIVRQAAADPGAATALVEQLTTAKMWREAFFLDAPAAPPAEQATLAALLDGLAATSQPPTRPEISAVVLARLQNDPAAGLSLWERRVPAAQRRQLDWAVAQDEGFTLFDWRIDPAFVGRVRASDNDLSVLADAGDRGTVVQRAIPLVPGRYRLSAAATRAGDDGLAWRVLCGSEIVAASTDLRGFAFTVPGNCVLPIVRIDVLRASSALIELSVGRVSVVPAAG